LLQKAAMLIRDQVKNFAKKLIEDRPDEATLQASVRQKKPMSVLFKDDGIVPNNPRLPLLVYPSAVKCPPAFDPAVVIDFLFETNGWKRSWRDTVYDFVHYHSQIHEVMGVARGSATLNSAASPGGC
jgi:uncharacterized protein YjlB